MASKRDKQETPVYSSEEHRRFAEFEPKFFSGNDPGMQHREAIRDLLPTGSTFSSRTSNMFLGGPVPEGSSLYTGSGSAQYHMQRPYMPEYSADKMQYPQDRRRSNFYWRMFHKYDPIISTAINMYSEMLVSSFDINVPDDDSGEIRDTLEYMVETVNFLDRLKYFVKEYLILGEAFPHLFWSDDEGIWTYIGFHNPDDVEVKDTPIINTDPILSYVPDDGLRTLLTDGTPEAQELRKKLPPEFVAKVMSRQKIRLAPLNCSFVARKLHPYDMRGTSLLSALWRINMVEDAVYDATIATYRRIAGPIRCIKLGDAGQGWLPNPEQESRLLDLLARAESDPACFVFGTPVVMADHTVRNIEDLKVGDDLLDRQGLPCKVEVLQEEESDELVHIDVVGSEDIVCTPNHKWPVWGGPRTCMCGCGQPVVNGNFVSRHYAGRGKEYAEHREGTPTKTNEARIRFLKGFDPYQKVEAKDIRRGDYLMLSRKFEVIMPEGLTLEKARLLGYYVAEGNTKVIYERDDGSRRLGVEFSLSAKERSTLAQDIINIVSKLVGYEPKAHIGERHNCQVQMFRNASSDLAEWLERHGGRHAKEKKLSSEVMSWPLEFKYEFLKGYIKGDGYIGNRTSSVTSRSIVGVSSSSINLINQVRAIAIQFGCYAPLYRHIQSEEGFGSGNVCYNLHFTGDFSTSLTRDIWGVDREPYKDSRWGRQWWCDDDYVYVKVRGVLREKLEKPAKVINMTVSGDHSYQVRGFGTFNSVLVWNYGIQYEAWGSADRVITIDKQQDVIERIKLIGLGLSKAFLVGEASLASVKGSLQVFLRRLLSLRQFLESIWIYPKFFRPVSQMNDWKKAKPSETQHRYRVKRTAQELQEQNLYIMPELMWHNKLDSKLDQDLLNAYKIVESLGGKISQGKVFAAVGEDWKEELEASLKEFKDGEEMKTNVLGATYKEKYETKTGPKPPGGAGAGALPPSAGGAAPKKPTDKAGPGAADKAVPLNDALEAPGEGAMPTTVGG